MSLLDEHEEHLATSLEDPDYWGVSIKFTSQDTLTTFTINGQVNQIGKTAELFPSDDISSSRMNCTVRLSTILAQTEKPVRFWTVETTPKPGIIAIETFNIEEDGFEDKHLGVITYNLTQIEIV
jgi:hypothetical protein